jgi:cell fate (sporulation/competence/biofilm development) regulator YlbF (YheA/YmcA/DUF963 family)
MNWEMTKAADAFIATLEANPEVAAFREAAAAMEADPELSKLRGRYDEAAGAYREKQANGSLDRTDIARLRSLQASIEAHPAWEKFLDTRAAAQELLKGCNRAMSAVLGFDFAATAAPAAAC